MILDLIELIVDLFEIDLIACKFLVNSLYIIG